MNLHAAFLPQTDPEATTAFYRDVLGFEVVNDVGYNGLHWITVQRPGDTASIVLYPPGADPGVTEAERTTITEMMAKGTFGILQLATPDLESTFAAIEAAGAEIVQEPTDQPYGIRDCAIRDPNGNLLRINQA